MNKCAGHSPSRVLGPPPRAGDRDNRRSVHRARAIGQRHHPRDRDGSRGAVLPSAKVTVVNEGTGFTRTVTTDANGEYTVPQLPTGRYTVMSEMAGFKTAALSNVDVGVDQRVRIDVKLEVGAMTESVTIEAETPLLQTSSSELGTTVRDEQIEALPLNGRNFVNLTRTVPGVLRGIPGANIDGAGSLAWRASASFSANGQRAARQQLHARRRRQQRDLAADGRHLPERRCARRVQAADDAPTRPSSAARSAASSTCRSSRAPTSSTAAASSSTATTRSTPTTSSTTAPAGPSRTSSRTSSAARSAAPCSRTRRSSSATTRATARRRGRRSSRRSRRWRCATATSPS